MSNRQLHLQQSPQRLDDGKCGGGGATEILEFPTVAIPAPIASGGYLLIRRRKKGAVAQLTSYANQPPLPFKGHLLRIL